MLNKSFAFSLLAAGLMIAPGAAFAGIQNSQQTTIQNSNAIGNRSTVVNSAAQQTIQDLTKIHNGASCASGVTIQSAGQNIGQNGVALGDVNTIVNQATQGTLQTATDLANGYKPCF
ncbi:MAG: filamentous hemagglutinin [Heteroscytonema crispum UTEX LB 1556]